VNRAQPPRRRHRKEFIVTSTRRTAIATGSLLVIATVAALAADAIEPARTGTDHLTEVAEHSDRLAAAALLYLIAAGTCAGIAIALYPLLSKVNSALALGSVVFRTIEAVFYTVSVVALLSILHLGRQLAGAPTGDRAALHEIAGSLLGMRDVSTLAGAFAFCVAALMYYALFYRSRLVPRWLSVWGLAGALLFMSACMLALFSNNPVKGYAVLILPIAVQEMVLALWLLAKGFSASPDTSRPSTESSTVRSPVTSTDPVHVAVAETTVRAAALRARS